MIEGILHQPFLTSYFVLAGFLIAAGVFFDRLAGEPLKKKIASYLQDNVSLQMDLAEYTKYFVSGSIGKYFHGDIITGRNFTRALNVSLISITVVVLMYAIKNNQNPLIFLDVVDHDDVYIHALGLIFIFAAVIIGDVFSILQTALLLNLVGTIRSAYDVVFLLVCDLIITINIFVFALPIGLQWAVVANDFIGSRIALAVEIPETNVEARVDQIEDNSIKSLAADKSVKFLLATSIANHTSQPSRYTVPVDVPMAYRDVDPVETIRDMMLRIGSNVRDVRKLDKLPDEEALISIFLDKPHVVAEVYLSNYLTYRSRANTYGLMFAQSRIAQNVFPMVVGLEPVMLHLGDVYSGENGWTQTPHPIAKNYYFKCDKAVTFVETVPDLKPCREAAVIGIGAALRDTYVWSYRLRPYIKDIPIAPLAFSCLFLTFSFYATMLLSFAMIKTASFMHFVTFTYKYIDIEKSTFVSIAAFGCVFLIPIFAVAFAFYRIVLS